MEEVFRLEPSAGGFDWDQCKYIIYSGILTYGVVTIAILIITPVLLFIYLRQIKVATLHHKLSPKTITIYNMLTKVIFIQLGLIGGSLIIPFIFGEIMFFIHNKYGSLLVQFIFFPIGTHTLLECLTLLFMITPYRRFIIKVFKKAVGRWKKVQGQVAVIGAFTMYNSRVS